MKQEDSRIKSSGQEVKMSQMTPRRRERKLLQRSTRAAISSCLQFFFCGSLHQIVSCCCVNHFQEGFLSSIPPIRNFNQLDFVGSTKYSFLFISLLVDSCGIEYPNFLKVLNSLVLKS